jgi:RHS repeat-associated protein
MYANGEILMQHNGNHTADRYFYLHDRLGSVREIINTDGAVVRNYTYGPFGQTIEESSNEPQATSNCFMFTGQWFDPEIGQYYLRARQYDPQLMRFTAYDPVFGQFEEPMTLHKYLYCGNDPVNKVDLTGKWIRRIHNQIINEAFRDEFSRRERSFIKQGSRYVDEFQDLEDSYMHAMRAPDQSVENAAEQTNDFIDLHLRLYEFADLLDWHEEALFQLGMAMHPVMDSTNPLHEGFQIWWGLGDRRGWEHIENEPLSISRLRLQRTITLMNNTMR